ncbi:MAG: FtsH protease activity modulator HflK [SAR202 cluster bacterium]|nr:FtsH protease activity modulator HflK [SAR202 cluster bacterium]
MQRQDEPEVNLEQILERVRAFFGSFKLGGGGGSLPYIVFGIIVLAVLAWAATGLYTVQPGEEAVQRFLGKNNNNPQGPGLHWYPPGPIGKTIIVRKDEVRRLELGFRGDMSVPAESLMITGDENIVDVQLLVQYDIKDTAEFLFNVVDPDGITMRDVAETSLRQVVGSRNIDDVLTTGKEDVQASTRIQLQSLLDTYQTGINIIQVQLQNVNPPTQVQDAFDDVVRAKEDKERIINLAEAYEEEILPTARGEAARSIENAEAFKAQRVNLAKGQAERFIAILTEYRKAPDVTRQRLYLEAMEEVLPGVTKFIVDPGTDIVVVTKEAEAENLLPLPSE